MKLFEARTWLRNNKNQQAFAGNRFLNNTDSLQFVENLYANGAVVVLIDNIFKERWRIKECSGPYADTLIVQLPEDEAQRGKLLEIFHEDNELEPQFKEELVNKGRDVARARIMFWWD
ncbi:MAG TPA: hypothetical protein VHY08_06190 [Bacillota bacterium]|nr:hypothetical protein [Bacillota bacterium]